MGNENGEWIMHGMSADDPRCIHTVEQLASFIDEVGFLPLFKNEVPGFSVEEHTEAEFWWSGDVLRDPWEWRGVIAGEKWAAYGKFFDKKAGFISKEWLPYFANARRDGYDFDSLWDEGKAQLRQKRIMEQFETADEIYSNELKQISGYGKGGEKNFDGVLTELQMKTYLCVRDFRRRLNKAGEPYGWAIAVYSTPEHIFGRELVAGAYNEPPAVSRERIAEHLNLMSNILTK